MATIFSPDADLTETRILPLSNITWDAILSLPDNTQIVVIQYGETGHGMAMFDMNAANRAAMQESRERNGEDFLPDIVLYSLPAVVVPDIEDFMTDRKDADNHE